MFINVLIFIVCFLIFSIWFFIHCVKEYREYIKKTSDKYSIENIDERIAKYDELIENGNFRGRMLEDILDERDIWWQIRDYKLNKKLL